MEAVSSLLLGLTLHVANSVTGTSQNMQSTHYSLIIRTTALSPERALCANVTPSYILLSVPAADVRDLPG